MENYIFRIKCFHCGNKLQDPTVSSASRKRGVMVRCCCCGRLNKSWHNLKVLQKEKLKQIQKLIKRNKEE